MLRRGLQALLITLLLLAGACAERTSDPSASGRDAASDEAGLDPELIGFGEALAQIRGHHLVALELYEAEEVEGATTHAGHPIVEIFDSVKSELGETDSDVGELLESALQEALAAVEQEVPAGEVATKFEDVAGLTEDALGEVAGDDAGTAAFRGSVIAALLGTAANEYEEAVGNGDEVRLLVEYQDGYGFVTEARHLYEDIASDVASASTEEAEEIDEAFEVLAEAFPSPEPPDQLVPALEVESAAELIGHELEETVNAEPLEEADPEVIAAEIEELLDEVVEAYEAGEADEAAELAAEAYLENYEVIEAEVIELAPDVNAELEPLLGAELRRQIQEGAPPEDIEAMVERAKDLLAEALEAIEHEEG